MSNTILIKRSGTASAVPASGSISLGELAINYTDGNLFYKDGNGDVKVIASNQFLSVVGNVTANNGMFTNIVNTTSFTGTVLSVSGNVNAANLSLSGNVLSPINTTANITTTGNISGNYLLGNIAFATGYTASKIYNGTSEVNIGSSNGNANISINGTSNVVVVADTGVGITGNLSATGNITGGNLTLSTTTGNIIASRGQFYGNLDVYGNLNATVGLVYANSGIFYGNTQSGNGAAFAGVPGFTPLGSNVVMQFAGNVNSYSQLNFQNINSGNLASTDFIATADDGSDSNYYVDVGINSSTFDDPVDYPGFAPHDSYVHNHGGNLLINPETAGKLIKFMVGGTDTTDIIATMSNTQLSVSGIVSATGNITGSNLTVNGGAGGTTSYSSDSGNYSAGGVIITQVGGNKLIIQQGNWSTSTSTILALPSSTVIDVVYFGTENYTLTLTSGFVYNAGQDWYEATYTSLTPTPASPLDGLVTTISFTSAPPGGVVSATGNIIGGNVLTGGLISATGNVFAPAIIANTSTYDTRVSLNSSAGIVEITSAGNSTQFTPAGQVNLSGISRIAGGTFTGSYLTVGTSQTDLAQDRGGNVTVQVGTGGTIASTWTFAQGGNLLAPGAVSAVGNVTSNNISFTNSATGTIISVSGNITSAANISGGNVLTNTVIGTNTTINSTGNITLAASANVILGTGGNVVINNVADPVQINDAANKGYVDSVAQGLDIKASVELASTVALPGYTYNNGASGVGATLTGTANGILSLDSTSTTALSRVLIKNEVGAFVDNNTPSAAFNGIYVVTQTGSPTAPFILTRSTDFDNGTPSGEIPGGFTFVEYGSTEADSGWVCTTDAPVTIGSTSITFVQFSGAGSYSAGSGLSLTGTQFNVLTDGVTTEINGSNQVAVKASANLTTPNIGAATGTSLSVTGNINAGNVSTTLVSATTVSATGNVQSGNILTGGLVSVTGNITAGNITTAGLGNITTLTISSGNVTASTVSTNTTSGAFIITGGLGVGGNVYAGALYDNGTAVLTVNSTVDGGTY